MSTFSSFQIYVKLKERNEFKGFKSVLLETKAKILRGRANTLFVHFQRHNTAVQNYLRPWWNGQPHIDRKP